MAPLSIYVEVVKGVNMFSSCGSCGYLSQKGVYLAIFQTS